VIRRNAAGASVSRRTDPTQPVIRPTDPSFPCIYRTDPHVRAIRRGDPSPAMLRPTDPSVPTIQPPTPPEAERPRRMVGRYKLLRLLGRGSTAQVHLAALDSVRGFRKLVALKLLWPSTVAWFDRLAIDLLQEARVGALLHHPNIVEIYDCGEDAGVSWIAMEHIDGVELHELVAAAGPLPLSVALEIGIHIASALQHAHALQVDGEPACLVHRDLSSSNVLIRGDGVVKVADFGIASTVDVQESFRDRAVGTPSYMAPEQALGDDLDSRADIFSLGALLFEMVKGRPLVEGASLAESFEQLLHVDTTLEEARVLEQLEAVQPGLGWVVWSCLRHDPDSRFESAEQVEMELRRLWAGADDDLSVAQFLRALEEQGLDLAKIRKRRGDPLERLGEAVQRRTRGGRSNRSLRGAVSNPGAVKRAPQRMANLFHRQAPDFLAALDEDE
jgi:serine/threonine protein kinase